MGASAPTTAPACDVGKSGPPSIDSVFVHLPHQFAGEVTYVYSSPTTVDLKALVGTAKSGNGDVFVDQFLSRVAETRTTPSGSAVIGYIPPPKGDLAATQESAKEGTIHRVIGEHSFVVSQVYGVLE
jgi:hypothetical protein